MTDDRPAAGPPNPVILIPGLLGSRLVVPGTTQSVWGDFATGVADPESTRGAGLFAFPMQEGVPLDRLETRSEADGTLDAVEGRIAGIPVRVKAYGDALSAIGAGDWSRDPEAETAFEFAYDFRRSIDDIACRFADFLRTVTRHLQVQRQSHQPVRFDVVAHSQGGLVLRWFLRYGGQLLPYDGLPRPTWSGAELIDRAIIVGTPSAGAAVAVDRLVAGVPGNPVHPAYGPVLMGSFPSGYQLLARARHGPVEADDDLTVDPLEPDFWLGRDLGLCASHLADARARAIPGLEGDAARLHAARDHLHKCLTNARAFQAAIDRPMPPKPAHLGMHLFVSDGKPTPRRVAVTAGAHTVQVAEQGPGDGTVLRGSALMAEDGIGADLARIEGPVPWDSVHLLKSGHLALMHDPGFLGHLPRLLGRAGASAGVTASKPGVG